MRRFIFVFLFLLAGHAQAALNDDFTIGTGSSVIQFPFTGDPANGTASYDADLDEITIIGADYSFDADNAFSETLTSFSITATSAGSLSFEWELTTEDVGFEGDFESLDLTLNGNPSSQILPSSFLGLVGTDPDTFEYSNSAFGSVTALDLLAGDILSFNLFSYLSIDGAATARIFEFAFTLADATGGQGGNVPEPSILALFVLGLAGFTIARRNRKFKLEV